MTDSTNRPDDGPSDIAGAPSHPEGHSTENSGPENAWAAPTRPVEEAPTTPVAAPTATADGGSSFRPEKRRGLLVPIVAAAVVAALIGGGAGAGIALAVQPHDVATVASNTTGSSNITINDTKTANAISAVAAKASPSVVTISVSAS